MNQLCSTFTVEPPTNSSPRRRPRCRVCVRRLFCNCALGRWKRHRDLLQIAPEDANTWIGVNLVDAFADAKLLHELLVSCGHCVAESCPKMSAGRRYEYRWADASSPTPVELPAPEYIQRLLAWAAPQLEGIDDAESETELPPDFRARAATMYRRLFRIYAHLLYHHHEQIVAMGAEPMLISSLTSFMRCVDEYTLISDAELAPLTANGFLDRLMPERNAFLESRRVQARRRWRRVSRVAPVVGGFAAVMRCLLEEVHYRPWHGGAHAAREHFWAAAEQDEGAKTTAAHGPAAAA